MLQEWLECGSKNPFSQLDRSNIGGRGGGGGGGGRPAPPVPTPMLVFWAAN